MIAFIALLMINTYILVNTGKAPVAQGGEKGWTVYGLSLIHI